MNVLGFEEQAWHDENWAMSQSRISAILSAIPPFFFDFSAYSL
jgi:hypothetical protein